MLSLIVRIGIERSQRGKCNNTNRVWREGVGIVERWRYFLHICYLMLIVYLRFVGTGERGEM